MGRGELEGKSIVKAALLDLHIVMPRFQ